MINRRGALASIGAMALGTVDWLISSTTRIRQLGSRQASFSAFGAELGKTPDDSLRTDLSQLGAHVYSDEGIPMFLACRNVAGDRSSPTPAPSDLNRKLASSFHRYAREWQHMHPDAPATDVAKIVELLASRDFTSGGTETSL